MQTLLFMQNYEKKKKMENIFDKKWKKTEIFLLYKRICCLLVCHYRQHYSANRKGNKMKTEKRKMVSYIHKVSTLFK